MISSTPLDTAPSHGRIFITTCNGEDHAKRADLDISNLSMNLTDPSPETVGGRKIEESPDSLRHGNGWQTSQGRRYNSHKSASWSDSTLEAAVHAVDASKSIRGANRCFGISPSSLRDHIYGRSLGRKRSKHGVLCKHEEEQLVDYIMNMQSLEWPMTIGLVRLKVAEIFQDMPNPFTHRIPR